MNVQLLHFHNLLAQNNPRRVDMLLKSINQSTNHLSLRGTFFYDEIFLLLWKLCIWYLISLHQFDWPFIEENRFSVINIHFQQIFVSFFVHLLANRYLFCFVLFWFLVFFFLYPFLQFYISTSFIPDRFVHLTNKSFPFSISVLLSFSASLDLQLLLFFIPRHIHSLTSTSFHHVDKTFIVTITRSTDDSSMIHHLESRDSCSWQQTCESMQ